MKTLPAVLVASAVSLPGAVRAAGLFAGDNGSQAAQRAGAFVAKADDPSALAHNPAGLVKAARYQLFVGGNLVSFQQDYQRSGAYPENDPTAPEQHGWAGQPFPASTSSSFKVIPTLAATQRFRRFGFGEGVFAPHGMPTRDFKGFDPDGHDEVPGSVIGDEAPGPQRYDMITQDALVAFPSLGAAFRVIEQLDVGARVSWGLANVKSHSGVWALRNDFEDPGNDVDFKLDVWDKSLFQFAFGLLARPAPFLELGAAYTSPIHVRATGSSTAVVGERAAMPFPGAMDEVVPIEGQAARCKPGETRTGARFNTCLNFDLPMRLAAGVRLIKRDGTGREQGDLEVDVRWEQWSAGSDVEVIVDGKDALTNLPLQINILRHGFKDTWSVLAGGSWRFAAGENAVIARAGGGYETGAARKQWTRLDYDGQDRVLAALGAGYEFGRYRVDAGLSVFIAPTREVAEEPLPANCMTAFCQPQPSPPQPLQTPANQRYHPVNAGTYDASYFVGSIGLTASF